MASLANQTISSTYDGLIKTSSDNAVPVSGVQALEDGSGNALALSVGRSGNGVTVSGNLVVDTNTLYVDAANNRVGVGKTPSSEKFEVNGAIVWEGALTASQTSAGVLDRSGDDLRIRVYGATAGSGNFVVRTGGGGGSADSEAMRIDSSGNVGINDNIGSGKLAIQTSGTFTFDSNDGDFSGVNLFLKTSNTNANEVGSGIVWAKGGSDNRKVAAITNYAYSDTDQNGLNFYVQPTASGSSAGLQEAMRIDSSGNVGIGESNPSSSAVSSGAVIVDLKGNAINRGGVVNFRTSDSSKIAWVGLDAGLAKFGTETSNDTVFYTANTERMRIDSSGNVGIGTTGGNGRLNVGASSASAVRHAEFANSQLGSSFSAGSFITLGRADINRSMDVGIYGNGSNEFDGKIVVNETGGSLILGTVGSERMRITSGGNVLIGTQGVPNGTSVYGAGFQNASAERSILYTATNTTSSAALMYFANPNGFVGNITVNGSTTSFNSTSDYRLKENVVEMTGALDRVDALKPSRFNYILDPEKTVDGFLAHEVQDIVPEAVTGEKDAIDEEGNPIYQGIDQSKIVPLLVGAIKELSAKVAALESQLNA